MPYRNNLAEGCTVRGSNLFKVERAFCFPSPSRATLVVYSPFCSMVPVFFLEDKAAGA